MKNFSAIPYKVKTNFKTDYYYLFATNNQQGLDEFIKEVCITNFEGGETNINNTLSCYRQKDKGGLLCIFLIGINKDWSKIVLPLGLIAVDNELPNIISDNNVDKTEFFRTDGTSFLDKPNKQTEQPYIVDSMMIHIPQNIPDIDGQVMILTKPFRGNHANFELRFGGDIKSISIKREIHRSYMRYSLKPETKVISLENKRSPYYFTYELDLGIGDNYIPIQVTDKRGNKSDYTYKISMVSVENDTPQINIDNNIDVWN